MAEKGRLDKIKLVFGIRKAEEFVATDGERTRFCRGYGRQGRVQAYWLTCMERIH